MNLWTLLKSIRTNQNLNQKEFAQRIGISAMYVSLFERDPAKGGGTPSEKVLREIAAKFSNDKPERLSMERELLFARAEAIAPIELAGVFQEKAKQLNSIGERMPTAFLSRLELDIAAVNDLDSFYNQLTFDKDRLDGCLAGKSCLPRAAIIEIAQALNQSVEEYLLLSNYLPKDLSILASNKEVLTLFKSLGELSPTELDQLLSVVSGVLKMHHH